MNELNTEITNQAHLSEDLDSKKYELSFLLSQPEAENQISKILNDEKVTVIFHKTASEVRLAYPINKKTTAFFGFYQFTTKPESVEKIKKEAETKEGLLRLLLLSVDDRVKEKNRSNQSEKLLENRGVSAEVVSGPTPRRMNTRQDAVSNEVLEEKLEEILK